MQVTINFWQVMECCRWLLDKCGHCKLDSLVLAQDVYINLKVL